MNVNKNALSIIDKKRIELRLSGGKVVSREDMLTLLLRKGASGLTINELIRRREQGVICITSECRELPGVAMMPNPHELAAKLEGNTPSFTVVFGGPGSGATNFINIVLQILRYKNADITLFDLGPSAANIYNGMSCFEQGAKALVSVTADTYDDAVKQITYFTSPQWLNSRDFQMLAQHHRLETGKTSAEPK